MKQKVIALLEPYRDKTLSFGCEVTYEGMVGVPHINMAATVLKTCASGDIEIYTSYTRYMEKEDLKIIGHPLTLWEAIQIVPEDKQVEFTKMWKQGDLESQSDDVFVFLSQFC